MIMGRFRDTRAPAGFCFVEFADSDTCELCLAHMERVVSFLSSDPSSSQSDREGEEGHHCLVARRLLKLLAKFVVYMKCFVCLRQP